jgi:uncharacterized protein YndB with AHSA1/START domain
MTKLTLIRRIAARPSIVFDALVQPEAIVCWWSPDDGPVIHAETDLRLGGCFRIRFRTLDGGEHEACGEYLEIVKPSRLVMSWRWTEGGEADEAGAESRLEIDLRPIEIGTELTFTHANLHSQASRAGHERGWNGAFGKLEGYLLKQADRVRAGSS